MRFLLPTPSCRLVAVGKQLEDTVGDRRCWYLLPPGKFDHLLLYNMPKLSGHFGIRDLNKKNIDIHM